MADEPAHGNTVVVDTSAGGGLFPSPSPSLTFASESDELESVNKRAAWHALKGYLDKDTVLRYFNPYIFPESRSLGIYNAHAATSSESPDTLLTDAIPKSVITSPDSDKVLQMEVPDGSLHFSDAFEEVGRSAGPFGYMGMPYRFDPAELQRENQQIGSAFFGSLNSLDQWFSRGLGVPVQYLRWLNYNNKSFPYTYAQRYKDMYSNSSGLSGLSYITGLSPVNAIGSATYSASSYAPTKVSPETYQEDSPLKLLLSDEEVEVDNPDIGFLQTFGHPKPEDFKVKKHLYYAGIPYHPRLLTFEKPFENFDSSGKILLSGFQPHSYSTKFFYNLLEGGIPIYTDDELSRFHDIQEKQLSSTYTQADKNAELKAFYDSVADRFHADQITLSKASRWPGLGLDFVNPLNALAGKAIVKTGSSLYRGSEWLYHFLKASRRGRNIYTSARYASKFSKPTYVVSKVKISPTGKMENIVEMLNNPEIPNSSPPYLLNRGLFDAEGGRSAIGKIFPEASSSAAYSRPFGSEVIEGILRHLSEISSDVERFDAAVYGIATSNKGKPIFVDGSYPSGILAEFGFDGNIIAHDAALIGRRYSGNFRSFQRQISKAVDAYFSHPLVKYSEKDNIYKYFFRGSKTVPETLRLYNILANSTAPYVKAGVLKPGDFVRVCDVPALKAHLDSIASALDTLKFLSDDMVSFSKSSKSMVKNFGDLKIPKQVVPYLEESLSASVALPPRTEQLIRLLSWPSKFLLLAPGQMVRNFVGNNISAVLAENGSLTLRNTLPMAVTLGDKVAEGVFNLSHFTLRGRTVYDSARELLERVYGVTPTPSQVMQFVSEYYQGRIGWMFKAYGQEDKLAFIPHSDIVVGSGMFREHVARSGKKYPYFSNQGRLYSALDKINTKIGKVADVPLSLFAATEDAARHASYEYFLLQGKSPAEALRLVNEHHYYYPRLSPGKRALASFFPFYQYKLANSVHNIKYGIKNPLFAKAHKKVKNALEEDTDSQVNTRDDLGERYSPPVPPLVQKLAGHDYNNQSGVLNFKYNGNSYSSNFGSFLPSASDNLLLDNGIPFDPRPHFLAGWDFLTKPFGFSFRKLARGENWGMDEKKFDPTHPVTLWPKLPFVSPEYSDQIYTVGTSFPLVRDALNLVLLTQPEFTASRGAVPRDPTAVLSSVAGFPTRKYSNDRVYLQAASNCKDDMLSRFSRLVSLWRARPHAADQAAIDKDIANEERFIARDNMAYEILQKMRFLVKYSHTLKPSSLYKTHSHPDLLSYTVSEDESILRELKEDLDKKLGKDVFGNLAGYGTFFHAAVSDSNYYYYLNDEHKKKVDEIRGLIKSAVPVSMLPTLKVEYEVPLLLKDPKGIPCAHGFADIVATYYDENFKKCAMIVDIKTGDKRVPNEPAVENFLNSDIDTVERSYDRTIFSDGQLLAYAQTMFNEDPALKYIKIANYQGFGGDGYKPQYTVLDRDNLPRIYTTALDRIYRYERPKGAHVLANKRREQAGEKPLTIQEEFSTYLRNLEALFTPHSPSLSDGSE